MTETTGTAPAVTPGQAAYERSQIAMHRRFPGIAPIAWGELDAEARADWESVAQDAIETAESHSTIYLNEIDRLAAALRTIRDAHAPGEPGFDVARQTLDDASRVIGVRPVRQPAPDPRVVALDPALLHREVHEQTRIHELLLTEILLNAGEDFKSADERHGVHVAEAYVRWLEGERDKYRRVLGEAADRYLEGVGGPDDGDSARDALDAQTLHDSPGSDL